MSQFAACWPTQRRYKHFSVRWSRDGRSISPLSSCGVNVTRFIWALWSQQKNTHFDVNILAITCLQYSVFWLINFTAGWHKQRILIIISLSSLTQVFPPVPSSQRRKNKIFLLQFWKCLPDIHPCSGQNNSQAFWNCIRLCGSRGSRSSYSYQQLTTPGNNDWL